MIFIYLSCWGSWWHLGSKLGYLGPKLRVLGPSWLQEGRSWYHFGSELKGGLAILAATWGVWGLSWLQLGRFCFQLGRLRLNKTSTVLMHLYLLICFSGAILGNIGRPHSTDVCCPHDIGREGWEWVGHQTEVWQDPTPRTKCGQWPVYFPWLK